MEKSVAFVEETDDESTHDGEEEDNEMPLLKYNRLFGSLPRHQGENESSSSSPPLASECTAAAMGKVILNTETTTETTSDTTITQEDASTALWQQQSIPIAAIGLADASLFLIDAVTGTAVASPDQLVVRTDRNKHPIVAVSLDSSGTQLAAIDAAGLCAIFTDLKYAIAMRSSSQQAPSRRTAQHNAFSSFMSAFTGGGGGGTQPTDPHTGALPIAADRVVPTLTLATPPNGALTVQRVSYPKSFGKPTCLALDPAYKRRREKALLVGFDDGRLVLTKRGMIFQRRTDSVVYQAVKDNDHYFAGIEALVWRGPLVAFADNTGVRLLDSETLVRIAHIDRPTGARPSLYPSVHELRPSLCFETSHDLLVAWGDCLLNLHVREATGQVAPPEPSHDQEAPTEDNVPAAVVRRRTVECTMAWQLDCVACGVVPLDQAHVAVLGLVPPEFDEDGGTSASPQRGNDLELQVVSRSSGAVVYADLLPLVRPATTKGVLRGKVSHEPASSFCLLSSFAVPRMDNTAEVKVEGYESEDLDALAVFTQSSAASRAFRDLHLQWSLDMVAFEESSMTSRRPVSSEVAEDTESVDSDDYGIIFDAELAPREATGTERYIQPPVMLVVSSFDAVLARPRNIDDAISFALSENRAALALYRGLGHRRQLRRYSIKDLVNEYLRAVLRIPAVDASNSDAQKHLSLRRMKLAAEAMPVLLGGDMALWNHWVSQLGKIPGALFVARNFLPVRDPLLPKEMYAKVLEQMLEQIEDMERPKSGDETPERLAIEAENHFLNALLVWGSLPVLREYLKLFKNCGSSFASTVRLLETGLARRREQTSAGYLRLVAAHADSPTGPSLVQGPELEEPLFDVNQVLDSVLERIEDVDSMPTPSDGPGWTRTNSRVALDAAAKLNAIKGCFDESLRFYLLIGVHHPCASWDVIETQAVSSVNTRVSPAVTKSEKHGPYEHVLSIIGNHHLHQCLLNGLFLFRDDVSPPLFALARLVGLDLLGDFLVEHCVAPQGSVDAQPSSTYKSKSHTDKTGGERRGTLPVDLVAAQVEASPKMLMWYLHRIFQSKPSVYVVFPNTANPPSAITALHRQQINLYVKYAGDNRDSAKALRGIDAYRVAEMSTPLLAFLRVVLQLGGIQPAEVGKTLEIERKGGSGVSSIFALELAYIMEHFGEGSEEEARLVLELYLKGVKNLMLAVSYAQRVGDHSPVLWQTLIDFCLSEPSELESSSSEAQNQVDGTLFGSLLEAAALSGADLSHLVKQIPPGMSIEGLRPRLVAAVVDYRLKLQMRETASELAINDKVDLLRELAHRSRRGIRCDLGIDGGKQFSTGRRGLEKKAVGSDVSSKLLPTLRTRKRADQFKLAYSLPIK